MSLGRQNLLNWSRSQWSRKMMGIHKWSFWSIAGSIRVRNSWASHTFCGFYSRNFTAFSQWRSEKDLVALTKKGERYSLLNMLKVFFITKASIPRENDSVRTLSHLRERAFLPSKSPLDFLSQISVHEWSGLQGNTLGTL